MKSVRSLMHGAVCVLALTTGACASTPRYPVHEGEPIGSGGFTPLKPQFATSNDPAPAPAERRVRVAAAEPAPRSTPAKTAVPTPAPVVASGVDEKPLEAPKPAPKPVPTPPPLHVTVKSGDTIYDVAARNRSPVRGIIEANGLTPPYELHAGQSLTVPKPAVYFVQEGDTLYGLARRFTVDVHSLATLNDLSLQSRLRLGQPISLPPDARDSGPSPTTLATAPPPVARPTPQPAPATQRPPRPTPPPATEPAYAPGDTSVEAAGSTACSAPAPASRTRRGSRTVAEAYAAVERSPTAVQSDSDAANEPPPTPQTPFDTAAVAAGAGKFVWPVHGQILSTFGPKPSMAQNDGVDIGASYGAPVYATADGHVVFNGTVAGQGKTVLLKHYDDNWASVYGQLSRSLVKNEEKVRKGQVIACIGQASTVPQPQLHFELRYRPTPSEKHRPVNPLLILPRDDER